MCLLVSNKQGKVEKRDLPFFGDIGHRADVSFAFLSLLEHERIQPH